ncbi:uncharacterized protein FMAN_03975 [Fusarium mangiferae]|uniref:Uncharacterized protein n=1 Tax=Fusarium mangiferae TaxID=192010 RepID=A0A1L7U5I7_FUSMA|nr:uncharacterized protein FMAN_03975 [Fusarium mangiferae]CVL06038.1 uncharacterized protein FMAN_03975 [Fusarium mangiferae]
MSSYPCCRTSALSPKPLTNLLVHLPRISRARPLYNEPSFIWQLPPLFNQIVSGICLFWRTSTLVGVLKLLNINQIICLTNLLEEALPYVRAMQKYRALDPSKSSSEGVDSLKRITPQNTQESLTEDPHDQHLRLWTAHPLELGGCRFLEVEAGRNTQALIVAVEPS